MILKVGSIPRPQYLELFKWMSDTKNNPQINGGGLTEGHICFITKSAGERTELNGIFWEAVFEIHSKTPKDKLAAFVTKVAEAQTI